MKKITQALLKKVIANSRKLNNVTTSVSFTHFGKEYKLKAYKTCYYEGIAGFGLILNDTEIAKFNIGLEQHW